MLDEIKSIKNKMQKIEERLIHIQGNLDSITVILQYARREMQCPYCNADLEPIIIKTLEEERNKCRT